MKKLTLTLSNPRVSPAQKKRWKPLLAIVAGSVSAVSEQSRALAKLQREVDNLDAETKECGASGDTSAAAAQRLSTLRTRMELTAKKLADFKTAATRPREDKVTQERLEAFNTLSNEVAAFFRSYLDERIEEFSAIIEPLWHGRNCPTPRGWARDWLANTDLLTAVSERFIVRVRDRQTGIVGNSPAQRLVNIVEALLSGKRFFTEQNLQYL